MGHQEETDFKCTFVYLEYLCFLEVHVLES